MRSANEIVGREFPDFPPCPTGWVR
jgi:hypothetical protein